MYEIKIEKITYDADDYIIDLRTTKKIIFSDAIGPIGLPDIDVTNENGTSTLVIGCGNSNVRNCTF